MLTAYLAGVASMCLIVLAVNARRLWIMRCNKRVLDLHDEIYCEDATVFKDSDGTTGWYRNCKRIPTFKTW